MTRKLHHRWHREKLSIFGRIKEALKDIPEDFHRLISRMRGRYERAKEILLFIPVLWECLTWDYSSIYTILEHWLGRMRETQNSSCHLHAPKYAKQMTVCINLLKRLQNTGSYEGPWNEHDEKWGNLESETIPSDRHPGMYEWKSWRPKANTPALKEQELKEFRQAIKKEEYLRQQDEDMLFEMLKKYHKHWWS